MPVVGKDYYDACAEPQRIVSVRLMDPSKFGRGDPIEKRGTHEVVLSDFDDIPSYIFRNDGDGWRIASIASDGLDCGEIEMVLWDYLWYCKRLIGLL